MSGPPVIDVSVLLATPVGDPSRRACERALLDAAIEPGFFYVVGHGVDEELQQRLDACAAAFFALPAEEKRRIEMAKAGTRWGTRRPRRRPMAMPGLRCPLR